MARIRQVKRADGTLVPFRERKVADAIARALRAAGHGDRSLAYELAGVVSLFLARNFEGDAPTTGDVREILAQVLRETGHEEAARRFEVSMRERERLEDELMVRYPRGEEEGPLSADGQEELAPWSRVRMIAGLMRTREIPESLAEDVTEAIEERLIRCGYRVVSRSLLAEMVDHELVEQGLSGAREPRVAYRLLREDVRRLAAPDAAAPPADLERALGERVLRSHALAEIHAQEVVAAHRQGVLHLHGLSRPFRLERVVLPTGALTGEIAADPAAALMEVRAALGALRPHVRSALVLPDLAAALAEAARRGEDPARLLRLLVRALDFRDAFGRPEAPHVEMQVPLGGAAARGEGALFLEHLCDSFHGAGGARIGLALECVLPPGGAAPRERLLDAALKLARRAPETGFRLPREGDGTSPGAQAPLPLRVSLGRITLNLPMAFAACSRGGLNDALACLEAPGGTALQALKERFWVQREGRPQGLHALVARLGGPGKVQVRADGQEVDLDVWGLPLALELLQVRGVIGESSLTHAAARILGFMDYLLGAEWEGMRFRVRLGGCLDAPVRRRLHDATRRWAECYGIEDLSEVLRRPPLERGVLPVALPLFSRKNAPLLEAAFAERLGRGLALSLSAFAEGGGVPEALGRLHRETRLGFLTFAPVPEGSDVFEVQEDLFR